jgi:ubiquinone/menaquinone biosynthesis C-methylase UbiE
MSLDYRNKDIRDEILVRQRREMWTPEQLDSLSKHFRLAPGMTMLDAGCGHGYSLRTFGPRCMPGGRLVGIDRDPELLATAREMADAEGLGHAELHEGDIRAMPFDADTFDVVMAQVVLCHLPDPERALDEMIRVAKPGGCIAVFDNALAGADFGWANTENATVAEKATRAEEFLMSMEGRRTLGRGDWAVGLHMPAWMEARGLHDVDARVNERVRWMAPPYRSPAQTLAVEEARDRAARGDDGFTQMSRRNMAEAMRAVGADEAAIEHAVSAERDRETTFDAAVVAGTAAYSWGGCFWCIWGFK